MGICLEIFNRLRLVITILIWGDLANGNLKHLKAMLAELEFVSTHQEDLEKNEVISLIVGNVDKPQTGMLHHLRHVLTSQNWRIINAQMAESELIAAKQRCLQALKSLRE